MTRLVSYTLRITMGLALAGLLAMEALGQARLSPTRIVLDERTPSDAFTLSNPTNEPLTYRIELVDLAMDETGVVEPGFVASSARGQMRYGPRVVTVPARGQAGVRVQRQRRLEPGEYRTHVRFEPIETPQLNQPAAPGESRIGVQVLLAMQAPLVIRSGPPDLQVRIAGAELTRDEAGELVLRVRLDRRGSWSAYGDLYLSQNGEITSEARGVAIYPELEFRYVDIPVRDTRRGPVTLIYEDRYVDGLRIQVASNL